MEWTVNSPKSGDIIRTKVTFYHHYGIFINESRIIQFGLPDNVYTPAEEIKVLATDIYTFLQGGELEVGKPTRQELKNMRSPEEIVKLAQQKAAEIIATAQTKSREMRKAAQDFVDDIMRRADEGLTANLGEVRKTRAALKQQIPSVKE